MTPDLPPLEGPAVAARGRLSHDLGVGLLTFPVVGSAPMCGRVYLGSPDDVLRYLDDVSYSRTALRIRCQKLILGLGGGR